MVRVECRQARCSLRPRGLAAARIVGVALSGMIDAARAKR
jgi:hypothetical protein